MNIVFMGTPDFATESLKSLYEAGHSILAVVSQPDKKVGRGMKIMPTSTKEFALEKNIPVYQPETLRKNDEFFEELKKLAPDVIVVVAYGKKLPVRFLNLSKYGAINVHGSLLPKYRGAAPIQWAIRNGEVETGITTMYMAEGMDTGDIALQESIPIMTNDTYGTLYEKLKVLGGKLIVETLKKLEQGKLERIKQPENFSVAPMIFKEDCQIDFQSTTKEIFDLVRSANPIPGAWTKWQDKVLKIWQCEIVSYEKIEQLKQQEALEIESLLSGTIVMADAKKGLWVKTKDGLLSITEIQAPNCKRMNILEYLRGNPMEKGKRLE